MFSFLKINATCSNYLVNAAMTFKHFKECKYFLVPLCIMSRNVIILIRYCKFHFKWQEQASKSQDECNSGLLHMLEWVCVCVCVCVCLALPWDHRCKRSIPHISHNNGSGYPFISSLNFYALPECIESAFSMKK